MRTPDVSPADVPLPFNGYHLSLVSEREKIYESLARLGVQQAAVAPVLAKIEREASEWIARLNADDASADDRARFEAWRGRHPLNARAYEELSATLQRFVSAGPLVRAVSFAQSMNEAAAGTAPQPEMRRRRRLFLEQAEERQVDEILLRLHETGMDGLSAKERALLNRVSARYRNRQRN